MFNLEDKTRQQWTYQVTGLSQTTNKSELFLASVAGSGCPLDPR